MSNFGFNPITGKFDLEGQSVSEIVKIGTIFHAFTGIATTDNQWVRLGRVKIIANDKEFVAKIQFMRHNTYPYAELKDLRAGNILIRISCPWHSDRATDVDCFLQNAINITADEIKIVEVEKTLTHSYCDIYIKVTDIYDRYYFNYTWNTGDENVLFEVTDNNACENNLPAGTQFSCVLSCDAINEITAISAGSQYTFLSNQQNILIENSLESGTHGFNISAPKAGITNYYCIDFQTGATLPTIQWSETIDWGEDIPTIGLNERYEIIIRAKRIKISGVYNWVFDGEWRSRTKI